MNRAELILGISTAGPVEVAVLGPAVDVAQSSNGGALESLVTLTSRVLRSVQHTIRDVTLIGVCTGPGSFTGLRIGVAFARTVAQAQNIPIAGISSYDVAAFGRETFPIISVARGKRDYYYARVMAKPDSTAQYVAGPREVISRAAAALETGHAQATIVGPDFSVAQAGDAARAVALLARQAAQRGGNLDWTNIVIDYGQRPNAVMNWEKRRRACEEGPPV